MSNTYRKQISKKLVEKLAERKAGKKLEKAIAGVGRNIQDVRPNKLSIVKRETMEDLEKSFHNIKICGEIERKRYWRSAKKVRIQSSIPKHIPKGFVVEPLNNVLSSNHYSRNKKTFFELSNKQLDLESQGGLEMLRDFISAWTPDFGINRMNDTLEDLTKIIADKETGGLREEVLTFMKALPVTNNEIKSVRNLVGDLAQFGLVALGITCMCISAVVDNTTIKILTATLAVYCCWNHNLFTKCIDHLMNLFRQPQLERQGGLDPDFISSLFTSLWITYTGKPGTGLPGLISDQLKLFPKYQPTILQVTDWVLQTLDLVADSLCSHFGVRKDFDFWKDPSLAVQKFVTKAKSITAGWDGETLYKSVFSAELIKETIAEGENLLIKAKRAPASTSIITRYLSTLNQILAYFTDNKLALTGLRQEPVCVLFRGFPGNFKTSTVQHLTRAITAKVLNNFGDETTKQAFRDNPNDFVFNRQHENKYWEGYTAKAIVTTMDDFGQSRDQAGNPDNEYMNMIRMVNEFPMNCHMATMSKKDSVFFGSSFIFATSNLARFDPVSIVSRDAIMRRFTFDVIVHPKVEFCANPDATPMMQTLDKSKLPDGELGVPCNAPGPILQFSIVKRDQIVEAVSFDQLVEKVYNAFLERKRWFNQKVHDLDRTTREYFDEEVDVLFEEDFGVDQLEAQQGLVPVFPDFINDAHKRIKSKKPEVLKWIRENFYVSYIKKEDDDLSDYDQDYETLIDDVRNYQNFYGEKLPTDKFMTTFDEDSSISQVQKNLIRLRYDEQKFEDFEKWFMMSYCHRYHQITRNPLGKALNFLINFSTIFIPNCLCSLSSLIIKKGTLFLDDLKTLKFTIPEGIKKFMNDIYNFVRDHKFILMGAIGIISLVIGTAKLYYNDCSAAIKSRRMCRTYGEPVPQTVWDYDKNSSDIVAKIVTKNTYEMWIKGKQCDDQVISDYNKQLGFITFIKGQTGIVPFHFFKNIVKNINDDWCKFNVILKSNIGENFDHCMSLDEFMTLQHQGELIGSQDLTLVVFPYIREHATLINFFKTDNDIKKISTLNAVLIHPSVAARLDNHVTATKMNCSYVDVETKDQVNINSAFWYNLFTTKGDCGSLLVHIDPTIQQRKLIGVHVAGAPKGGYGVTSVITQEKLNEALEKISFKYKVDDSNFELESQIDLDQNMSQFIGLGKVEKYPAGPIRNEHIRSRMYGCLCEEGEKPLKVLSLLHPKMIKGIYVDPMINGLANYGSADCSTISTPKLKAASASYWAFLRQKSLSIHKVEPRLFDHEEIILGISGEKLFKSVNRGSSLGYPYNAEPRPGFKGKAFLLGDGQDFDLENPNFLEFMENVKNTERMILEGKRPKFIFTDNLKDEKLKREKVVEGRTRVFSAAPFDLVYLVRKYFGAFCLWFGKNNKFNGCAVGLNPYSRDWDLLAGLMTNVGGKHDNLAYGAGDYSKFDGSEKARIHWEILDVIQKFYTQNIHSMTPEEVAQVMLDCKVRHILWFEVVNSIHLVRGVLMMWCNSLPSGHPLTTVINNMYNHISMRYCWITLHNNNLDSVWSFDKHIYLCTMGDDQIFAVSESKRELYNEATISEAMKELALKYTSDTKDGVNLQLRKLTDITFLKRKFSYNKELRRWVAPLDNNTIKEICYWTKPGENNEKIVADHCDSMIMEWSLHGKEHFNQNVPKLMKSFKNAYPWHEVKTTDYEVALSIACNKEVEW